MKKFSFLTRMFWLLVALSASAVVFNACEKDDDKDTNDDGNGNGGSGVTLTPTTDPGVVINGVKWATRNVDAPGTFAATPKSFGKFYQWNRKKAWEATGAVTDWDSTTPAGDTWETVNDPSPAGWRVPTLTELQSLLDEDKVSNEWITEGGIPGRKFTDIASGKSLFLPAAGYRSYFDGLLYFAGLYGYYWSSAPYDSSYARSLGFSSGSVLTDSSLNRAYGHSVRCVAE
jgi:uncharacterized protein (TIGR02145 family)